MEYKAPWLTRNKQSGSNRYNGTNQEKATCVPRKTEDAAKIEPTFREESTNHETLWGVPEG